MSDDVKPTELRFLYRNHRGETAWRWVAPKLVRWGSTEFHPKPQWLLEAYDHDRQADRTFALRDIRQWSHEDDWMVLWLLPVTFHRIDDIASLRAALERIAARDQGEVGPHMEEPRAAAIAREVLE